MRNLLLLSGSAEAPLLAERLTRAGHRVTSWLTEPPRRTPALPATTELRDPADVAALRRDMAGFDAVLDLSHGFDADLRHAGFEAATSLGLPFISFTRPGWATDSPLIDAAPDVATAVRRVPQGARVFAATGWASMADFLPFPGSRLMLRQTSQHDRPAPHDFIDLVFGTPPFTVAQEMDLFRDLNVDLLICRNLGGPASRPKVDAALALGLPVILIDPPAVPVGARCVSDLDAVAEWVDRL